MDDPRITFHGAAGCVTGSCFRLETAAGAVLIDCGMFQGSKTEKELNYRPFPFDAQKIAAVVLTHAHIDHSGLLPKLVRDGFDGPIHATAATVDLCGVMLPDSAHIQEYEVSHLNRRNAQRRRARVDPIYTAADAAACLNLFRAHPLNVWVDVVPGLRVRFWNAGHLLGSASVEVECATAQGPLRLMVSGDIGPDAKLLQHDPEGPAGVDYVICESTYGDIDRQDATADRRRAVLAQEVQAAHRPDGVLLIPSFAVERAQELIADLVMLMDDGTIPAAPILLDSPLASAATRIFARHSAALEGGPALGRALKSRHLHFVEDVADSKALDHRQGFHIVIAASGMCEAGRIRHRLKAWIWREEATVLLVGYQAEGTLGRIMQDGARAIRIQGQEFTVRARIRAIDLYSGHADGPELAAWVAERGPVRHQTFLVHGEDAAVAGLAARLPGPTLRPALDQCWTLTPSGAVARDSGAPPRLPSQTVGRLDWHNDVTRLMLDLNEALAAAPDEKTRGVLIRRLRRALEDGRA